MMSENAIVEATNTIRNPSITAYSSGNWFQFSARNGPMKPRRLAANRNENSIEPRPSSRRIVPCMESEDEHAEQEQQEEQVEAVEVDDGFADVHAVSSRDDGGGPLRTARHRVTAPDPGSQAGLRS